MRILIQFIILTTGLIQGTQILADGLPVSDQKRMIQPIPIEWYTNVEANSQLQLFFHADDKTTWRKLAVETDKNGATHTRFQQIYLDMPVNEAVIVLHNTNDSKTTLTGIFTKFTPYDLGVFDKNKVEKEIASRYLPAGAVSIDDLPQSGWNWLLNESGTAVSLCFFLNYFPENSLHLNSVIIEGATLKKIAELRPACFANVPGMAVTAYQGLQHITCTSDSGTFYLKSTAKGNGIFTKNLNHNLNYQSVTEFTDADNYWEQSTNADVNYAADAHFCAEQYYDFLNEKFNRNSLDNNGFKLTSYLNYGNNFVNAFWNGQAVVYGSGDASNGPLTTADISGHEFTHGLIQKTANLAYSDEPGTINEAISDIFGVALESYANASQSNWLIGEAAGTPLRSFSNPNIYNQPAAYHGNFWYYGTGDQGGVHINSGFINKWFYILTNGEQGTNEFGTSYDVNGIGMTKSVNLVYHALTSYLVTSTTFSDFYQFTIQSAIDLHGSCSPEYEAILESWKAVGYGNNANDPQILINGSAAICPGDSVKLTVNHIPGNEYQWFRNGVLVASGIDYEFYATLGGNWQVFVNRCGASFSSDAVFLNEFPAVTVTTQNAEICRGIPVELAGYPSGGYFNIPNPYNGNSTSFTYTFTDGNGCTTSANGNIVVNELPAVNFITSSMSIPVNDEPVFLEANVAGNCSGTGVSGNHFYPVIAGVGGPWPVSINYVDQSGCSAQDSITIKVLDACIKSADSVSIQATDSILSPGQTVSLSVNASPDNFQFNWQLPAGCVPIGSTTENSLEVMWNDPEGKVILYLINTCNDTIRKEFTLSISLPAPFEEQQLMVYPNPAKGNVTVQLNGSADPFVVTIRDVSGKAILMRNSDVQQLQLNIENLESGYYSVETISGKSFCRKVLVIMP